MEFYLIKEISTFVLLTRFSLTKSRPLQKEVFSPFVSLLDLKTICVLVKVFIVFPVKGTL